MVLNVYILSVMLLTFANGFIHIYYAVRIRKKFPEESNFLNSMVISSLWFLAGILYPFFFPIDDQFRRFYQILGAQIICIYSYLVVAFLISMQYIFRIWRHPEVKKERTIENFIEKFNERNEMKKWDSNKKSHSFSTDINRKLFHLIPPGVIIILWEFAVLFWANVFHQDIIWGITAEEYGVWLIITIGYTAIMVFGALDYIRLSFIFEKRNLYHLMPKNLSGIFLKTLKRNEIYNISATAALVLSFVPIFFFPISVFAAAALIASLGDGAASLFGIKFGKHHFPKGSKKTVIGYKAGFIASFFTAFIVFLIFEPKMLVLKNIIISLSGGSVFFIVDVLNLRINDNILNPIFSGLLMGSLYFIL
jgi:dolichol kinase